MAKSDVFAYRRSPAAAKIEQMRAGSSARLSLREIPFCTQIGLRAAPGGPAATAIEENLGLSLPDQVGKISHGSTPTDLSVLWLAPDEFLLIAGDEAETGVGSAELAQRLDEAIGSARGQAVELSGNRTVLELRGEDAVKVLYKLVDIDVHPQVFAENTAVVTLMAGAGIILWRVAEDTWRILPRSSFAEHIINWVLDAMREYV